MKKGNYPKEEKMNMNKNYWNNVFRARKEIYDILVNQGIHCRRSTDLIAPSSNRIIDNGGIGIEFYYGIPQRLYTPLGYLKITDSTSLSPQNAIAIKKILTDNYGISLVIDEEYTFYGKFGPVYSITKLPWSSESLPLFELKEQKDYITSPISDEIYSLCKATL